MSILDRLNLGISTFKPKASHVRPASKSKPTPKDRPKDRPQGFNPNALTDAHIKALEDRKAREQHWQRLYKERRDRQLKAHPSLRTYIATLKAVKTETAIIYDGVLDIDIKGLIEELRLEALPPTARYVALQETRSFVSNVHRHHYDGHDPGDEVPWEIPSSLDYTVKEAQNTLFPNGITADSMADPEEDALRSAIFSAKA